MLGLGLTMQSLPVMGKTLVQRALAILKRYGSTSEGVWYDPSDFERYMAVGPELVVNGNFSNGTTGWVANSGSEILLDSTIFGSGMKVRGGGAEANAGAKTTVSGLTPGKTYLVSALAYAAQNNTPNSAVISTIPAPQIADVSLSAQVSATEAIQKIQFLFIATSPQQTIYLFVLNRGIAWGSTGSFAYFDSISVREQTSAKSIETMFQDAAGTIPVTAVEQPVGLILDKSKGLVLGAELVINGGFSAGLAGWSASMATLSLVSSKLRVTVVGAGGFGFASQEISGLTSGKTYKVSVDGYIGTGNIRLLIGNGPAQGTHYAPGQLSVNTTYSFYVNIPATSATVSVLAYGVDGAYAEFDNISVRELPGNHASQTVSTKRPTLSARVNLLTKTEDFGDAVWTIVHSGAISGSNTVIAPDGKTTADVFTHGATPSSTRIYTQVSTPANVLLTHSMYAKKITHDWVQFVALDSTNVNGFVAWFNLSSGAVGTSKAVGAGATLVSAAITQAQNGFYKISITGSIAQTLINACFINVADLDDSGIRPANASIAIWGASLVPADQAHLPYQRVNTATDYDAVGFPLRLAFDGVDDALSTPSIDFTGTDKMTVVAGVRKLSDAATGMLVELSLNSPNYSGSLYITAPESAGSSGDYRFKSRGTINVSPVALAALAPISSVVSGVGDISGDISKIRINGANTATRTDDQGTGTYGKYPLYIGSRAGTSLPFNGNINQLVIFGATLTAAELAIVERYVGRKTGITL